MKVLVLGASGMLGNTVYRYLSLNNELDVFGSVRSKKNLKSFTEKQQSKLQLNTEFQPNKFPRNELDAIKPDVIINCIGMIKQAPEASVEASIIYLNSLLPHLLKSYCADNNIRLIHFSTDCIFSGTKGSYKEEDKADADDLYGRSKYLGEISGEGTLTLRTSIIGHELNRNLSLLDWFLSEELPVKGFKNAFFSGLTTLEIAKFLERLIITHKDLSGTYHLSADRISKLNLLKLVRTIYKKKIDIIPENNPIIDRSLNSEKLKKLINYEAPSWDQMIIEMQKFK